MTSVSRNSSVIQKLLIDLDYHYHQGAGLVAVVAVRWFPARQM
jgi:hypothetical protein